MMSYRYSLALVLALAACGESDPAAPTPVPSPIPQIDGTWVYDEILRGSSHVSCRYAGTVTITQSGSIFVGMGVAGAGDCTDPTIDNAEPFTLTGQVNGTRVSFLTERDCRFAGEVSGSPPHGFIGLETCEWGVSGTTDTFKGTWSATR